MGRSVWHGAAWRRVEDGCCREAGELITVQQESRWREVSKHCLRTRKPSLPPGYKVSSKVKHKHMIYPTMFIEFIFFFFYLTGKETWNTAEMLSTTTVNTPTGTALTSCCGFMICRRCGQHLKGKKKKRTLSWATRKNLKKDADIYGCVWLHWQLAVKSFLFCRQRYWCSACLKRATTLF